LREAKPVLQYLFGFLEKISTGKLSPGVCLGNTSLLKFSDEGIRWMDIFSTIPGIINEIVAHKNTDSLNNLHVLLGEIRIEMADHNANFYETLKDFLYYLNSMQKSFEQKSMTNYKGLTLKAVKEEIARGKNLESHWGKIEEYLRYLVTLIEKCSAAKTAKDEKAKIAAEKAYCQSLSDIGKFLKDYSQSDLAKGLEVPQEQIPENLLGEIEKLPVKMQQRREEEAKKKAEEEKKKAEEAEAMKKLQQEQAQAEEAKKKAEEEEQAQKAAAALQQQSPADSKEQNSPQPSLPSSQVQSSESNQNQTPNLNQQTSALDQNQPLDQQPNDMAKSAEFPQKEEPKAEAAAQEEKEKAEAIKLDQQQNSPDSTSQSSQNQSSTPALKQPLPQEKKEEPKETQSSQLQSPVAAPNQPLDQQPNLLVVPNQDLAFSQDQTFPQNQTLPTSQNSQVQNLLAAQIQSPESNQNQTLSQGQGLAPFQEQTFSPNQGQISYQGETPNSNQIPEFPQGQGLAPFQEQTLSQNQDLALFQDQPLTPSQNLAFFQDQTFSQQPNLIAAQNQGSTLSQEEAYNACLQEFANICEILKVVLFSENLFSKTPPYGKDPFPKIPQNKIDSLKEKIDVLKKMPKGTAPSRGQSEKFKELEKELGALIKYNEELDELCKKLGVLQASDGQGIVNLNDKYNVIFTIMDGVWRCFSRLNAYSR
jgi:hypothetical protein